MHLKIYQRKGDTNNKLLYEKAIYFFANQLLSKSKQDKITLTVVLKQFKGVNKGEFATVEQLSRYNYKMEINKLKPFHAIISTIAHEMTHVKQGVLGKLVLGNTGFKWNGKMYKDADLADDQDPPYEAEAYALEPILCAKFFRQVIEAEVKNDLSIYNNI
jgi:hypothetical protein